MKSLFHTGSGVNFELDLEGMRKSQANAKTKTTGSIGFVGPAYTEQDRLLVDPLLKRNTWSFAKLIYKSN